VSNLYGDYVDADGNVVGPNVGREQRSQTTRHHFQGRADAVFHAHRRAVSACTRLSAGLPASHGCIRMPEFMAENFFNAVQIGTP
jgi:hypothetical protein